MNLDTNKISDLFKVLSDPNRLRLVTHLCNCNEANVGELAECCSIDLSVVSRHLTKLKSAGILGANKKGKEVFYDLNANELVSILRELADEIEKSTSCCRPTKEKS
jgi:ArsR family transcriptional regulator